MKAQHGVRDCGDRHRDGQPHHQAHVAADDAVVDQLLHEQRGYDDQACVEHGDDEEPDDQPRWGREKPMTRRRVARSILLSTTEPSRCMVRHAGHEDSTCHLLSAV